MVSLQLGPVSPDTGAIAAWWDYLLDPVATLTFADQFAATDGVMDPRPHRALAGPLTTAAVRGDERETVAIVGRLVGAGPGATPTGDDVIVGVLAALRLVRGTALSADVADAATDRIALGVVPALSRTTTGSGHDLVAAIRGNFAERVHGLARSVTSADAVPQAAADAAGWGATSGLDTAHGLIAGLDACTRLRSIGIRRTTPELTGPAARTFPSAGFPASAGAGNDTSAHPNDTRRSA